MSAIAWDSRLELGIANIDKQHKRWVDLYNDLDAAIAEGKEEEAVRKTVDELVDYTTYHFRTEEALMRQAQYDEEEYELHVREHKVFTDQMIIFRDRLLVGFQRMSPEVVGYLRDWLVTHITGTDRCYQDSVKALDA